MRSRGGLLPCAVGSHLSIDLLIDQQMISKPRSGNVESCQSYYYLPPCKRDNLLNSELGINREHIANSGAKRSN